MSAYGTALIGAAAVLITIAEMLRRRRLREKYAALWVVVGLGVLILASAPGLLFWLSHRLGVQTPVNLAFFVGALVLLIVSVQLSAEISTLEDRTRTLAEEAAALRLRIERLEATTGSRPDQWRPAPPVEEPTPRRTHDG